MNTVQRVVSLCTLLVNSDTLQPGELSPRKGGFLNRNIKMAYKQQHQYGYRDSLEKGDPEKVIYGTHFDDEFKAIEEAIAEIDPNADGNIDIIEIDGLQDALDGKADKDHTHDEYLTDAPNDGAQYVRQSQTWAEVTIPDGGVEEAPKDGTQYARQDGAWSEVVIPEGGGAVQIGDTFDGTPAEGDQWLETPAGGEAVMWIYDGEKWLQMPGGGGAGQDGITTATLPLANPTREATGLSTQSDANNYFAEAIAKVVNDDGEVALTDYYTKTEADAAYQPKGDYIGDAPNDGEEYARKNQGWVKLQGHNYTGADAVKLTGDQSVAGHKTWTSVATFGDTVTMRGTLNGDDTANFQNAVTAGSFVKSGGTSSQFLCADGSVADSSEYD